MIETINYSEWHFVNGTPCPVVEQRSATNSYQRWHRNRTATGGVDAFAALGAAAWHARATEGLALDIAELVTAHAVATDRRTKGAATAGGQFGPRSHAAIARTNPYTADGAVLAAIAHWLHTCPQAIDPKGTLEGRVPPGLRRAAEAGWIPRVDGAAEVVVGTRRFRVAAAISSNGRTAEGRQKQSRNVAAHCYWTAVKEGLQRGGALAAQCNAKPKGLGRMDPQSRWRSKGGRRNMSLWGSRRNCQRWMHRRE
eukprot:CAMPEP_0115608454 /NCGR_PEP_ID=MMETSP0272-20121206/19016_1 /TAXON_ID=71861 /ORGANISM="Scrippsiella trochoidea, Strain CCMP3099" /LENGTH=253 /DNA_ID=CAMNT_0003044137 /DNA_START=429 /DNA_END=1187 /DNA_ORIENTATION=+